MEWIHELFQQYGYYVVLVGLLLEYIALPFPGEPTLAYAGFLSHQGDLSLPIVILLSFIGTSVGTTFQYLLGNKLGMPFIQKYGKYVFLTPQKINLTKMWFDKYGYFLIFIAFFIPGVRHFTGYFSGIINLPFRRFAITIYSGALFWVSFFLIGGYWLGENLEEIFQILRQHIWKILFGIIIITLITRFRKNIKHMILKRIN
ncbi:DedA family protein [Bacillus wiedmannii]|uniref:DedA family protein n=1 Tax=Bacillus wiedmannii TaxID=1890302 RepID=UPI000BF51E65|nr:DedA family protein [Bacillus wiedmannii]MEE3948972.1 DedA family protein [Bacillus wiedmannii]PFZ94815.1 alkaline phosphatase [Bacillus wiedmannii]